MDFKPKIIGFLCNWCSYAGADLAGVSRIQYPPNIRILRLMCSGRVEPFFIFEALKTGIDGVIIMGCHPGECHYMTGNYEAEMKYQLLKSLLTYVGLDNRISLEWVSASEGIKFAEVVTNFTNTIQKLGPSPLKKIDQDSELLFNLNALQNAGNSYRLRALIGRKRKILGEGNVYNNKYPKEKFENLQETAMFDEYQKNRMILYLKKESLSVKGLSEKLNIVPNKILEYIVDLRGDGLIDLKDIQNVTPYYIAKQEA